MKKIYTLAAILLAAASCSKEVNFTPETPEEAHLMHIEITATKAATKTVLADEQGESVLWCDGDALTVFDTQDGCSGHEFGGTLSDDPTKASFLGDVHEGTTTIQALYPYDANASISGGIITTSIRTEQTATAGTFANGAALAYAAGEVDEQGVASGMVFTNLCAVLAFKTPSYLDAAQKVVVTAKSGASLAGTVTIENGTITSVSGSSSVTLGVNAMEKSSTYFVAVAPGTYTNGFTFDVTTKGGSIYTAQTTKTLNAEAGNIYMLGTVGLVVEGTPAVTLTHTYSDGILTGTAAVVSIPGVSEKLAQMASWDIQLKNSEGVLVRSFDKASGTMTVENDYIYLPQDTYTLATSYTLNNNGSVKTRMLANSSAVSPAPSISVTLGGYTSYDCYKGTNGRTQSVTDANACDGSTIYDPSVTVNISAEILQSDPVALGGLFSGSYSYDGNSPQQLVILPGSSTCYIPNKTQQSWAKHTLDATFSFDGVNVDATQRIWHITGLPWADNTPGTSGLWNLGSSCSSDGTSIQIGNATAGGLTASTNRPFYCPANINVAFSSSVKIRTASLLNRNGVTVSVGGSQILDQDGPRGTAAGANYDLAANGTVTSSNSSIAFTAKHWGANSYVWIYSVRLNYR